MKNLIDFLTNNAHWFLLLLLELLGAVLLFKFNSYQGSVYYTTANAISGKIYEIHSSMLAFINQAENNEALTQRNYMLEQELARLQTLLDKDGTSKDSTVIAMNDSATSHIRTIPAKVITNEINKSENYITINKGTDDGVRPDMAVTSGLGPVGVVYMSSAHYSIVVPLINTRSSLSVRIRGEKYFGNLRWDGQMINEAEVEDIPRFAKFDPETAWIETSGYSSIFPEGIIVGKVKHVFFSSDGLAYRLNIELTTDFARLRDVLVIDNKHQLERINLMRAAKDSINVNNK